MIEPEKHRQRLPDVDHSVAVQSVVVAISQLYRRNMLPPHAHPMSRYNAARLSPSVSATSNKGLGAMLSPPVLVLQVTKAWEQGQ